MSTKPKSVAPAMPPAIAALSEALVRHRDLAGRAERAAEHLRQCRAALHDAKIHRKDVLGRPEAAEADDVTAENAVATAARAAAVCEAINDALGTSAEAVRQARALAQVAISEVAERHLRELDHSFAAAVQRAMAVAVEALAVADAAALRYRLDTLLRLQMPSSILKSDATLRVSESVSPLSTQADAVAASLMTWRSALAAAERAEDAVPAAHRVVA